MLTGLICHETIGLHVCIYRIYDTRILITEHLYRLNISMSMRVVINIARANKF